MTILIVDDDRDTRSRLVAAFKKRGCETEAADGIGGLLSLLLDNGIQAVVVDGAVMTLDEIPLFEEVRRLKPSLPMFITTEQGAVPPSFSSEGGTSTIIPKPYDVERLTQEVQLVVKSHGRDVHLA